MHFFEKYKEWSTYNIDFELICWFYLFSVHQSKRPVLRRRNVLQDHANERVPYSKIVFSWWYLTLALLFCIIANYLKRFSFCTNFPVHTSYITLTNLTQKLRKKLAFFVLYNSTAWIVAARDLTKDHNTDVTYYVLACLQFFETALYCSSWLRTKYKDLFIEHSICP